MAACGPRGRAPACCSAAPEEDLGSAANCGDRASPGHGAPRHRHGRAIAWPSSTCPTARARDLALRIPPPGDRGRHAADRARLLPPGRPRAARARRRPCIGRRCGCCRSTSPPSSPAVSADLTVIPGRVCHPAPAVRTNRGCPSSRSTARSAISPSPRRTARSSLSIGAGDGTSTKPRCCAARATSSTPISTARSTRSTCRWLPPDRLSPARLAGAVRHPVRPDPHLRRHRRRRRRGGALGRAGQRQQSDSDLHPLPPRRRQRRARRLLGRRRARHQALPAGLEATRTAA